MFQWDKSITSISIPAGKVVNLFRSMRDVQMALPGIPGQMATAFVCQYHWQDGIATVAAFHLHKSGLLAFYASSPRIVPAAKSGNMLDQCLNFVESMGFLLTDQDFHLLEPADQDMLWSSLPLGAGLQEETPPLEAAAAGRKGSARTAAAVSSQTDSQPTEPSRQVVETGDAPSGTADPPPAGKVAVQPRDEPVPQTEAEDKVDDLLAAVEALRNRGSGPRARRSPPSAQELARRRSDLCITVGRILASH
jgi:hypothetical protein